MHGVPWSRVTYIIYILLLILIGAMLCARSYDTWRMMTQANTRTSPIDTFIIKTQKQKWSMNYLA